MKTFKQKFLTNTDETGRLLVISLATNKCYFVEPISTGKPQTLWGDVDPANKKLTGDYGNKLTGAVLEKDSLITAENGFEEIAYVTGSYMQEIEQREQQYLKKN